MPVPSKVQLIGGAFQDNEGNPLALGYLLFELSQDAQIAGVGNIASGITTRINLDANGNVIQTPGQFIWGNDQMLPINAYYRVTGYTAQGQPAWGPNNQQVIGNGGTFNLNTWVPNTVLSWFPPLQQLQLQTNEVNNGSQVLLDLHAGSGVTLVDNGSGRVTISSAATAVEFKVNGTDTTSQTILNFQSGSGISVTNPSAGNIKISLGTSTFSPITGLGNWRYTKCYTNSAAFQGYGYASAGASTTQGSTGVVPATATDTNFSSVVTASSPGFATQAWGLVGANGMTLGATLAQQTRLGLLQTTTCRIWIGFVNTNSPQPNALKATNPALNICAFRYDSTADTNFQCYASTDASHFTAVDSGVPADTANHDFAMVVSNGGATVKFYIDGNLVGTISTNLPATNQSLSEGAWMDNVGTSNVVGHQEAYWGVADVF